jgi:hypothetical protein
MRCCSRRLIELDKTGRFAESRQSLSLGFGKPSCCRLTIMRAAGTLLLRLLFLEGQRRPADSLPFKGDIYFDAVGDRDEGNTFIHPVVLTVEGHYSFNLA